MGGHNTRKKRIEIIIWHNGYKQQLGTRKVYEENHTRFEVKNGIK